MRNNTLVSTISTKHHTIAINYNNHNLDLSYITSNIIAMRVPTSETLPLLQQYFYERHKNKIRVLSLCREDFNNFNKNLFAPLPYVIYPLIDHESPSIAEIDMICQDIDTYLKSDKDNTVVIHCHSGKGRTGLVIICYLLYSLMLDNIEQAHRLVNERRTDNNSCAKNPCQKRYVFYYERYLQLKKEKKITSVNDIKHETTITKLKVFVNEGNDQYDCVVVNNMKVIEVVEVDKEEKEVNIKVNGDVKLYFITKGMYGNSNKDIYSLFSMCEYMTSFNTFFEKEKSIIELNDKKDIDKIYKINSPSKYDKIKISIGLNNK